MDAFQRPQGLICLVAGAALSACLGGCGKSAAVAVAPPADVRVAPVEKRDVPVTREWVGALDGLVNAQIRAQVSGYLLRQDYREGSFVHAGDLLFEIDPRPFAAALGQAQAQLAQAEAQLGKTELDVKRFGPLAREQAISQQELDDAVQANLAAKAQVAAARAACEQARLNLDFSRISSPVDGVAGLVQVQTGDLLGPGTGVLTTVSTVDPIKAYFSISEQTALDLGRRAGAGGGFPPGTTFTLVLADGSVYPAQGRFFAIDRQVDPNTGTVRVAATFPNPDRLLRPGQFARVRAVVGVEKGALLVPLRAVSDLQGSSQVATVDGGNIAHVRTVRIGETVGPLCVVESGLSPGDRVVVEGLQKVREGAAVNPLPSAVPRSEP